MVTMMNARLGIAPHIVEAVVNHMSGLAKAGVAGVYNRALYLDDRRRALEGWGEFVEKLRPAREEIVRPNGAIPHRCVPRKGQMLHNAAEVHAG